MPKTELDAILDKLLARCASPDADPTVGQIIANERSHYIEPHHGKALSETLWTLAQAICNHTVIEVDYRS